MAELKTAAGGGSFEVNEVITLVLFAFVVIGIILIILRLIAGSLFNSIFDALGLSGLKNPLLDPKYDMNKDQLQEAIKTHAGRLASGGTTPILENGTRYERSILPNLGLSSGITNIISDMKTGQTFVRSQRTLNYDAAEKEASTVEDAYNDSVNAGPTNYGTILPEGITSKDIFKEGWYF